MLRRKSKVSTRFVIITSVIYSFIIILIVFSFWYILNINTNILRETVIKNNDVYQLKKIILIVDRLKEKKIKKLKELSEELKKQCSKDPEFLYIIIFSTTPDENYFQIQKKIQLNPSLTIIPDKDKVVQEKKETNYIKTAATGPVIDPAVYFSNNYYYKTVYHPFLIKKSNYIIEFIISSTEVINVLDDYSGKINNLKKYSIIISACAVIIIIIAALLFFYSFSLLIKNLSGHLKKAAEGSEIKLDPTEDDDLNDLTHSFSSAVSRIRQKKDIPADLFKSGVALLKEGNYDEAVAIFKTLTIINPGSFGSYFNLGVAFAKKQQYEISLEMFENALNSNSGHELTLDYIAKVKRIIESRKANGNRPPEIQG
jgi:tetratricopeptide (TPR) repeat protein